MAANLGAELFAQGGIHLRPRTIQTPQTKVVIHGLPGRELMREQPPRATTPHVEDGIQDFADRMEPRSAERFGWREQRVETSEFGVRQVGQIGVAAGSDTGHPTGKTDPCPGFQTVFSRVSSCWSE